MMVNFARDETLANDISLFVALAPAVYVHHTTSVLLTVRCARSDSLCIVFALGLVMMSYSQKSLLSYTARNHITYDNLERCQLGRALAPFEYVRLTTSMCWRLDHLVYSFSAWSWRSRHSYTVIRSVPLDLRKGDVRHPLAAFTTRRVCC